MKQAQRGSRKVALPRPKHAAVKAYVEDLIRTGSLKPGDKVPTEDHLTASLRMSRSPVRHALLELAREGVIYTLRGSGSYVKRASKAGVTNLHVMLHSKSYGIEKDVIHGIRKTVLSRGDPGIHLILRSPGANTMELVDLLSLIDTSVPGGLIMIPLLSTERSDNRKLGSALRKMENERFRVVQLDFPIPEYDGNLVMADHKEAAFQMTDHLIAEGHRRIAVVYEHPERTSNKLRMEGVRERLRKNGLDLPPSLRWNMPPKAIGAEGRRILERIARSRVTAVFAFQCDLALPLLRIFRREGVRIPEDVSLCTFDEIGLVTGRQDDLVTTAIQPLEKMGSLAADLALDPGGNAPPMQMLLKCRIEKRRSVQRLAP